MKDYTNLGTTFGAGSPARIIATALNGAAGSNAASGLSGLVQSAAVNVLQSLAVTEIKKIADSLGEKDATGRPKLDANGQIIPTTQSEAVRGALQAIAGCAGAAAGGADCGSGALGAAASVALNNLIRALDPPKPLAPGATPDPYSLEEQQARTDLIGNLVGAIATVAGLNANTALTAAQIETENNAHNERRAGLNGTVQEVCIDDAKGPCPGTHRSVGDLMNSKNPADQKEGKQIIAALIKAGLCKDAASCDTSENGVATSIRDIRLFGGLVEAGGDGNFDASLDQAIRNYNLVKNLNPNATPGNISWAVGELSKATPADAIALGGARSLLFWLSKGNSIEGLRNMSPEAQSTARNTVIGECSIFLCENPLGISRLSTEKWGWQKSLDGAISTGADWTIDKIAKYNPVTSVIRVSADTAGFIGFPNAQNTLNAAGDVTVSAFSGVGHAGKEMVGGLGSIVVHPQITLTKFSQTEDAIGLYTLKNVLGQNAMLTDLRTGVSNYFGGFSKTYEEKGLNGLAYKIGHDGATALTIVLPFTNIGKAGAAGDAINITSKVDDVAGVMAKTIDSPSPMSGVARPNVTETIAGPSISTGGIWSSGQLPGSIIRTFTTVNETTLVRVSTGSGKGEWFVDAAAIAGKTPEQIQQLLALPYTPTHIQTVKIPKGVVVEESIIGPQPFFPVNPVKTTTGGVQYNVSRTITRPDGTVVPNAVPEGNFGPLVPLPAAKPLPKPKG